MLAAACGSHKVHHAGVARLLVVTAILIGYSCSFLKMLLKPLPIALGGLPGVLHCDVGQSLLAIARDLVKLGCLVAGGILGGDAP
jgi:hypothetical protein